MSLALLLTAWIAATRPFQAPDEPSHYLRALTLTEGHLLGPVARYDRPVSAAARAFVDDSTRAVIVPDDLAPPLQLCEQLPSDPGHCRDVTPTGNYYPLAYVAPAAVLAVVHDPTTGLWLGRGVSAAVCLIMFLLAIAVLWDGRMWSMLGLLAAVTPMTLFVASIFNPSGLSTAASIAFACALLRITRDGSRAPNWVWVAMAIAGAATILAFQTGPGVAAVSLLIAGLLSGFIGWKGAWRAQRGQVLICGLTLLVALGLWFAYDHTAGVSKSGFHFNDFFPALGQGLGQLQDVMTDAVGNFGGVDVPLPHAAVYIWWGFWAALLALALWLGNWRERAAAAGAVLLALAFPVALYAFVYRMSGFGLQGRQVLPTLVLIGLVPGEVISRRMAGRTHLLASRRLLESRYLLAVAILLVAGVQGWAWYTAAHVAATKQGGSWAPPLGWLPWQLAALAGVLVLLAEAAREGLGLSWVRVAREETV